MTLAEDWDTNTVYSKDQSPHFDCIPLYASPAATDVGNAQTADGWVLVPKEPTQEMIDAAVEGPVPVSYSEAAHSYAAMLSAAPTPPIRAEVTGELLADVLDDIRVYRDLEPEEDESWESWYFAAFDLIIPRVRETFQRHAGRPALGAGKKEGE